MRGRPLAVFAWAAAAFAGNTPLADLVNPLIGTAHEGQTYPATGVPFAMTQWTPETRSTEAKCIAPYYYADSRIQGFRGSHFLSGSCLQDYGSFTIMPESGRLIVEPAARASAFDRASERALPYRYEVTLSATGVKASITGTVRSGIMRFQFPQGAPAWILIESHSRPNEGEVRIDGIRREISGFNPVHRLYAGAGKPAGFSGYFVARFSRPFKNHGTAPQSGTAAVSRGYAEFDTGGDGAVTVKIGTSFVSLEEARRNLDAEIPGWDFDTVASAAAAAWNRALGQIEVRDASEARRRVYYTALYHSMMAPRVYSDADGSYPRFASGQPVETANGFTYYCDFTLWDTFRALHPLLTIIDPQRSADMMQSLVAMGRQGGWMPVYPAWNSYTQEMIGDHAVAAIEDAYSKGIRGFDIREAYRLIRRNATETPESHADYVDGRGRRALQSYLKHGFVPLEDPVRDAFHSGEQVSRTLEYAYDDFVVSRLAESLGETGDAVLFRDRARNYRNIIDPKTGFARGRHADGSWSVPFDPSKPYPYITEGLPFQYTFFVPQDIAGLIELLGGREAFLKELDALFAGNYYDHGNEPSHHIAYLYDYAGAPWKTQERLHQVMQQQYQDGPAGLAGNDDGGQMSAWYVLSGLGLYPASPGVPVYEIGTPVFDMAIVHTSGARPFTICAPGAAAGKFYVQSATLNSKPLERPWITHQEILDGGELIFVMGDRPNKEWASAPDAAPPSLSKH
jgi:predicted alpha-1,2-mannosidase